MSKEKIYLKYIPKSILEEKCKICRNYREILSELGLAISGSSLKVLKKRIKEYNIVYSPISGPGKTILNKKQLLPITVLKSRTCIKKRIKKEKLLTYKCTICNLKPFWRNKPLSLHLDHINGISNDNRLENLRFLCPNCHSQTDTFGCKRFKKEPKICTFCNISLISHGSERCFTCWKTSLKCKNPPNKKFHITKEELEKLIWEKPALELSKQFGITATAIIKRCRKMNIKTPGRGYWNKQKALNS